MDWALWILVREPSLCLVLYASLFFYKWVTFHLTLTPNSLIFFPAFFFSSLFSSFLFCLLSHQSGWNSDYGGLGFSVDYLSWGGLLLISSSVWHFCSSFSFWALPLFCNSFKVCCFSTSIVCFMMVSSFNCNFSHYFLSLLFQFMFSVVLCEFNC